VESSVAGSEDLLYATYAAVHEPDLHAAGMVSASEDVLDRALDLATGWLVGFEDDGYGCSWVDLAVRRDGHNGTTKD
jgi:hypothetical protein